MEQSIKDKLLSCRTYDDAKPILETIGAGVSAHELARTAYSIQAKQPTVAHQFLTTVIQETEDEEEKKKVQEVDGGSSEQSSSTTGLEKVGSEENAAESFHTQTDKKDQMGVPINEVGGFPPQGQMPPQVPQQQMGGGCGGTPQMPPQMNPQQQMQYTVQEIARHFAPQFKNMQEAIKTLDKKIQETQKEQVNSLDLGSQMGHKKQLAVIKETTGDKNQDLRSARDEITKMNNYLNTGKY
jgi:hypothetical protein